MKKIILVCLCFTFACKNKGTESKHEAPSISVEEKKKLLSIIHGGWVKEDYANSHSQTKSPYHSYQLNQSFVELIIDTSNVRGDTLMNPGCHTNGKESYYFKIIMEHDSLNKTSLHMMYNHNYKEPNLFLDYSISSSDTTLFMVKKDMKTGEVKSKTAYKRVYTSPLQNNYSYNPIDIFLNRILFTGKYKLYDEKNKLISASTEFTDWGVVKGFPGYDHYYLGSDMFSGFNGNYQTDYIRFVSSDEKLDVLGWNLENGVFTFYDLINNGGSDTWKKSKLKFRMVRL